ncbi:MAG: hypothetical protein H6713_26515 [Myxococcales bacterium]|nr:hypothetical protein [Myxococcales bacterium]MCB9753512.1 hypothetical protein [Myxococcales bacterium]
MARKSEQRLNLIVGLFVVVLGVMFGISLYIIGQGRGAWKQKSVIYADFRSISGLKKGSPVQIEGIEIGVVKSREFVEPDYLCDPATEDKGRYSGSRTDACDRTMFCAPEGMCAELEPFSSNRELHPPCSDDSHCNEGEVCVTRGFRRRYRNVTWTGSNGVCAAYTTQHKRIRVALEVFTESLQHIRDDSRASVSQNGVLGDQLVQISAGRGEPIQPGGRIQSTPSLIEDLYAVKDRVDGMFVKVEEILGGVADLAQALADENTVRNVQGLLANANEVSRQVAEGKGLVGALLNDEAYVVDFGSTLRSIRNTAGGLDRFVKKANSSLGKLDQNIQPIVAEGREVLEQIKKVITEIKDPNNKSVVAKLLYDDEGKMVKDLEETVDNLNKVIAAIERGEGSAGKLIKDPKAYDDLVKLLGNIERNNTLKRLVRYVMEKEEAASASGPTGSPAGASGQ